jgi:hypothetical protein
MKRHSEWVESAGASRDTVCAYAADCGNLSLLKSAYRAGFRLDEWTCIYAAGAGRIDILKWAINNGCPYDCTVFRRFMHKHSDVYLWVRKNLVLAE